jgi:phosphoesterase RecJ-like protein
MSPRLVDLLGVPTHRRDAIRRLAAELLPGRRIALSTHINADGDGCGSEVALSLLLQQLGVESWIVNPTPWPAMFEFLLEGVTESSDKGADALTGIDALVVLDISDIKRLGTLTEPVRSLSVPRLVVDHHVPGTEPPGDVLVVDTYACATGELVFDIACVLDLELTPPVSRALYTAIVTDTGGFRFSNTTPRCQAIASQLLAHGVDPEEMYRRIYASVSLGRMHLLRDALATLDVDASHGLSWLTIPSGALERYNVLAEELDGIAEYARSIAGTRMAIFFRDLGHRQVKVSFRSTGDTDVNRFAHHFGGGGHAKAAGALISGTLEEVSERVLREARKFLANGGNS